MFIQGLFNRCRGTRPQSNDKLEGIVIDNFSTFSSPLIRQNEIPSSVNQMVESKHLSAVGETKRMIERELPEIKTSAVSKKPDGFQKVGTSVIQIILSFGTVKEFASFSAIGNWHHQLTYGNRLTFKENQLPPSPQTKIALQALKWVNGYHNKFKEISSDMGGACATFTAGSSVLAAASAYGAGQICWIPCCTTVTCCVCTTSAGCCWGGTGLTLLAYAACGGISNGAAATMRICEQDYDMFFDSCWGPLDRNVFRAELRSHAPEIAELNLPPTELLRRVKTSNMAIVTGARFSEFIGKYGFLVARKESKMEKSTPMNYITFTR